MNTIEEMRRHLMNCELAGKDVSKAIKTASESIVNMVYAVHMAIRHEHKMPFMDVRM